MSEIWKIAAFYQFADLNESVEWAERLLALGKELNLRGTLIVAPEGINSTCAGLSDSIDKLIKVLKSDTRFAEMPVKYSEADFCPFPKFKVKQKPEIVTFRQEGADPQAEVGTYLEPDEWNELIQHSEVLTIDTRNDYEVKVGHFKGGLKSQNR